MMFNQSNDLPFDPVNLSVQPITFTMENPPYVPQSVSCNEALYPYVNGICALLANEIQSKATGQNSNFLRVFMYNQCAPNNFRTEAFDALVHSTLDFIAYMLSPPVSIQNPTIENAIEIAVPEMVYMLAAINCQNYPRLGHEVPPQLVGAIKGLIDGYNFYAKEIDNLKRGGQKSQSNAMGNRSSFGARTSFGGGGNVNNNNRGSFGNTGGQQQGSFGGGFNATQSSTTNRSFGAGASSGLFDQTSKPASSFGKQTSGFGGTVRQVETTAPVTRQYDQPAFNQKGNTVQNTQAKPNLAEELSFLDETKPSVVSYLDHDWVRSTRFPYFPAFNNATMSLVYEIQPDGSTKPVVHKRDANMDYDRHALPSVFGNVPESHDLSKTAQSIQRIQRGAMAINSESALAAVNVEEGQEEPKLILNHPEWFVETSLTAAWLVTQLTRMELEEAPDVFRASAMVTTPVIITEREVDTVKALGLCMTYKGLREQLEASYERMTPELYQAINSRITKIVNHSIRLEMGIPDLSMTDFRTDIIEVLEYIEEMFGKDVLQAFTSRQEMHIKEATATLGEKSSEGMVQSFIASREFPGDIKPTMICLSTAYSLTLVNVRSFDLELELGGGGLGSVVTKEIVPEIHELVSGLFSAPDAAIVHRHLIRTLDGRVMEAARGAIGEDFYTLSLVE